MCTEPFERVCHYLHYLHYSLASGQTTGGTENWIKGLLTTAPPIRTRPNFPLSQSLPFGSFHNPFILIRGLLLLLSRFSHV